MCSNMIMNVEQLREGMVLKEDVFSLTNSPIVSKKTVILNEHIEVLKAFFIEQVEIETKGEVQRERKKEEQDLMDKAVPLNIKGDSFVKLYQNSIEQYKKEYLNWQAGSPVDIQKLRKLLLPTLQKGLGEREILSLIYQDYRAEYQFVHPVAVAILSGYIASKLKYKQADIIQISLAGLLADIGMTKITSRNLYKKDILVADELAEIKKHPVYGYKAVSNVHSIQEGVKYAVLQHHERYDGSGYPIGSKGSAIHPYAQIVAVADVYHAMTSERIYQKKKSPYKVLETILQDEFGKFDITSVQALIDGMVKINHGNIIRLSNDEMAEILFVDQKNKFRPLIKLSETGEILNLAEKRYLYIDEVLAD